MTARLLLAASTHRGTAVGMKVGYPTFFSSRLVLAHPSQRRSPRGLGYPGQFEVPCHYSDGGASHREGAQRRRAAETLAAVGWVKVKKPTRMEAKRALMAKNRKTSHEPAARDKAEATKKKRANAAVWQDKNQKRSRRISANYNDSIGKGEKFLSFFFLK